MAVLRTRCDDRDTTPGDIMSVFFQPLHLVSNCFTDGLQGFGIFETDLQGDLHEDLSERFPIGWKAILKLIP